MSDKPDLSELFQMLAEEKAKASEQQKKKKKKSKEYQKDFIEQFSLELKKLKKEEEQQKRDIAAMEAWLTSPVVEKDEKPELEVEAADESVASSEPVTEEEIEAVEQVLEEDKEILKALAETPLQEQALQYLNDKRDELSEEAQQIKTMKKEMTSFSEQLTKLRMLMQNMGGGGIVKLRQADDIDTSTALVNDKFLKYNATTGKFVGADASGGAVDLSAVDQNIVPATTETYDLGTTSKRWNDLFLAGETIDLGGTKISKDSSGDVSFKDSSNNLKKVIVEELHIGTGANKLKLTRDANGKLKALDNSDAKASHDVEFSEITGTPTTIAGYGITDAFDGAYSSLTGAPTIPTVDSTSVTAAGALMDSEVTNLAQVKAFDSSDYATAAQGTLADSALQSVSESDVTAHQAALSITESQISDLGSYITNSVTNTSTDAIMTFTTTEDSSSAGPVIDLKRNSSSPADSDYIGQIKFRGENDADQDVIYAKVSGKISDVTDGTEDGLLEIALKHAGGNRIVARFTGNELKLLNNAGIDVASGGTIDGELASTATATTASTGDNSTKIATTAFVQQEITALKALLYAYDQS